MHYKKQTSWKKSRKFGDVMGGRTRPKIADKVFNRMHNFHRPVEGEERPLFFMDNPTRDFYFPVTAEDVKTVLKKLPTEHTEHLTHIWFRKFRKTDYLKGETYQSQFICGSGVNLIVFYPFPKNLRMRMGKNKPVKSRLRYYSSFTTDLREDVNGWYLQWDREQIKRYYLERLLLFQIGNAVESHYQRFWSKAAGDKTDKRADNWAKIWSEAFI